MQYQLKSRQVCFFLIAFMPISKLFVLPSILAGFSAEDMWLSTVFNLFLDFLTLLAVVYACKKSKKTFFNLLEDNFGKTGMKIVLSLYLIYFTLKAILPINEQKDYVELTLYTLKPTIYYFLPFFLVAFYLCTKKIRVLGRASDIMWLITINGVLTLFVLSLGNADFGALLPVGAHGIGNIVKGSFSSLNWFGDAVYIMFFIGEFEYKKKDGVKILLSFLIGAVMIIAFMIIFYCIFTSIAYRQRFALTEISKYTTVINNLGRFDYIGIILILFANLFSLSLPIYFSCKIINKLFSIKKVWIAPTIVVSLQALIPLFFNQHIFAIQNFLLSYASVFFFITANVIPILTAFFAKKEALNANA